MSNIYIELTFLVMYFYHRCNSERNFENIALSGKCEMSSTEENSGNCYEAIDNDTNTSFRPINSTNGPNCVKSDFFYDCHPFWELDLGEETTIFNITIYGRIHYLNRMRFTNVTVDGILCKHFGSNYSTLEIAMKFRCASPIKGRKIRIAKIHDKCGAYLDYPLNICEVQVWVCRKGWHGEKCNTKCSTQCSGGGTICDRLNGQCITGCQVGWYGNKCERLCPSPCFSGCNQESGSCFFQISSGNMVNIVIGVSVCASILFILVIVGIIRRRKPKHSYVKYPSTAFWLRESSQRSEENLSQTIDDTYRTEDIFSSYSLLPQWDKFQQAILSSLISGHLSSEFQSLLNKALYSQNVGRKSANLLKNRFTETIPYDHNRVILRKQSFFGGSDYINASYIKGYKREVDYIASQCPLKYTVKDMWLMIWQEDSTQVIFLMSLRKQKQHRNFWPKPGQTILYGKLTVTGAEKMIRSDFIIHLFKIKAKMSTLLPSTSFERTVEIYQYMAWPTDGLPSTASLVNFWRHITARENLITLPIVICSSGVERTGVYIALDIAMRQSYENREIDVKRIVSLLREDRFGMVPTESLYKFVHAVILEAYTCKDTRHSLESFDVLFPDPIDVNIEYSPIDKEFKILQQMKGFVPRQHYSIALEKENIVKIRNTEVLPDNSHLVELHKPLPGRQQFINAVFLSSFKQMKGFILTQLPLPSTRLDFWRLVDEYKVNSIVSLGSSDDETAVHKYTELWPKTLNQIMRTGPYDIKVQNSTTLGWHVVLYKLLLKKKDSYRTISVFHYTQWKNDVPEETEELLTMIDTLYEYRRENDITPIIIQCIDGGAKSGLFCVMCDIFHRAVFDKEVDVFFAVRSVHTVRPQFLTKKIQYRYCYKIAQIIACTIDEEL